ncbi:hypothetical protein G5C65_37035, partial [Streptomyces sp. SB3404]|nr:hypothetical protein [Streptomyces boncukensis]
MVIAQDDIASGTALLLAASPSGKSRLTDAASVLPALAAVSPQTLTGTASSTVVELADPIDPQTVLTRIRAAAAEPGPLLLCIAGQLQCDHKQRLPHLALARSTPSTLRYTGFPWHWLASELGPRPAGTTTLIADLVADAGAFGRLRAEDLAPGHGVSLYGRLVPPPEGRRRTAVAPGYLQACAETWRSGARPPLPELHEVAAAHSTVPRAVFLAVPAAPGGPPPGEPALPAAGSVPGGAQPVPRADEPLPDAAPAPLPAAPDGRLPALPPTTAPGFAPDRRPEPGP